MTTPAATAPLPTMRGARRRRSGDGEQAGGADDPAARHRERRGRGKEGLWTQAACDMDVSHRERRASVPFGALNDDDGGKEILPLCWTGNGWKNKAWPAPRPLYNLDKIALRPDAKIIICEGEKAADAAALIFPDFVATTSSGGAQSAAQTDWAPLAGRRVLFGRYGQVGGRLRIGSRRDTCRAWLRSFSPRRSRRSRRRPERRGAPADKERLGCRRRARRMAGPRRAPRDGTELAAPVEAPRRGDAQERSALEGLAGGDLRRTSGSPRPTRAFRSNPPRLRRSANSRRTADPTTSGCARGLSRRPTSAFRRLRPRCRPKARMV